MEAPCFVVGIGASAGGQEALEQIFTAMPTDCGISFVVIMHLPPDGPSFLAEMLSRYTPMEVVTAEDGMALEPNRVQVIPAGRELVVSGGRLRLEGPEMPRPAYHPINRFFHSLAPELKERAVAVVLSGFGTDGTAGVKDVREAGGIVIVQEPESAVNPAMPQSAIATGMADFILPPEEIPARIAEIAHGTCPLTPRTCQSVTLDDELRTIFSIVKTTTGHDFSSYKTNTVMRRIERRMAVNEAAGFKKYISLLEANPQEAHALCQDILIGVTSFFRDPDAFEVVRKEIIPRLFADRAPDEPVRIWHACCATGEEVYSMAILIREYLTEQRQNAAIQIFATDIDEAAIGQARAGLYGDDIEADVGEERIRSFFTRIDGRWQVTKQLREMVVFAHHSLIKDPPFSRLDLLVCRNFLIYLNPDMQKRLISLFHQVIKPGGFLFLGSAESVGHHSELFATASKKWKIFTRREGAHRTNTLFPLAASARTPGKSRPVRQAAAEEPTPAALAEKLLMERYAPPCVVVNEKYEVVHISSRPTRFLEVPVGEPTRDILKMAREELRPALRAAIYKCFAEQKQVVFRGVKVGDSGEDARVNVLVEPLSAPPSAGKLVMVVFEPAPPQTAQPAPEGDDAVLASDAASREMLIRQLEEQLRITHEQLHATVEQLETSHEGFLSANEELMSINEEFQSANEELQSTNEELETSKEELQALNEELVTVNAELQGKVEELNQANSDMENLLASSGIATLFLDRQLNIKSFTPAVASLFNLIPADIGRPFRHLAGKIDWSTFTHDTELVLAGRPFAEQEVTTLDRERTYLKRIFPYRGPEGGIEGIVVTFIDITDRKRMGEAHARLAAIVESSDDAVIAKDLQGTILTWNAGAERMFGYRAEEVLGRPFTLLIPPDLQEEENHILQRLTAGQRIEHYETVRIAKDGRRIDVSVTISPIRDGEGRITGISKIARDITEHKRMEKETVHLASFPQLNPNPVLETNLSGNLTFANPATAEILHSCGLKKDDSAVFLPPDLDVIIRNWDKKSDVIHYREVTVGERFFGESIFLAPRLDMVRIYCYDITKRRQAEEALSESEGRVRRKLDAILTPEGDLSDLDLADIIDVPAMQSLMDDFYRLSHFPMSIIDTKGTVLVGVGWADICTKFHRFNPETCKNCMECDTQLTTGIPEGEFKLYKCRNNMWDVATPIMVGGRHLGNLFSGQFFFCDEPLDYEAFRTQAKRYGFNEDDYLAALGRVRRLSRDQLASGMAYLLKFATIISKLSYANIKLARSLAEREVLLEELRVSEERFRVAQELSLDAFTILAAMRDENGEIEDFRWVYANPEAGRILQYPPEVLTGRRLLELLPDNRDQSDLFNRYVRVVETGQSHDYELRYQHEGIDGWFRNMAVKLGDGVAVCFSDITERKRTEEALRSNNEELTRFNTAAVGRELRMIELKREINALCEAMGNPQRYLLDFEEE